ncbi:MarR family winged helix-turn-helix transcriptional regulator [Agromyces seonyuensis]|uniref:MarR family transcriptional regulator n=1 Tax=Agromyces seonyuensis TaxID=2662446 RepID=A0A6I4NU49_9MICO|nr:MarR family transcriptional regulator [Agromyces seonyuensis]MWB97976.1 MarR family transcriptional regulator [Agromyces seonyuensis]
MSKSIAEQGAETRIAVFRLARRLRAQKSVDDMSDGQFAVLAVLNLHGTQTLTSLAEHEKVSAPSMNRTVDCLEESGWLARTADERDRRKMNIDLTDAGRAVVKATVSRRDAWLTERLRALPKEDREILARATEIMRGITAE